jgi:hypothetical protein
LDNGTAFDSNSIALASFALANAWHNAARETFFVPLHCSSRWRCIKPFSVPLSTQTSPSPTASLTLPPLTAHAQQLSLFANIYQFTQPTIHHIPSILMDTFESLAAFLTGAQSSTTTTTDIETIDLAFESIPSFDSSALSSPEDNSDLFADYERRGSGATFFCVIA